LSAENLSLPARILVVADIYDALAAKRPYRDALPLESVLGIISKDVPKALDASCFEALKAAVYSASDPTESLLSLSSALGSSALKSSVPKETRDPAPQPGSASPVSSQFGENHTN
jgi:HD-GYP domain-containing protein (c-di-GMP phosphodiesterase class II)